MVYSVECRVRLDRYDSVVMPVVLVVYGDGGEVDVCDRGVIGNAVAMVTRTWLVVPARNS